MKADAFILRANPHNSRANIQQTEYIKNAPRSIGKFQLRRILSLP
jgi:hypothetical protein